MAFSLMGRQCECKSLLTAFFSMRERSLYNGIVFWNLALQAIYFCIVQKVLVVAAVAFDDL
jgi:hypothetical protein